MLTLLVTVKEIEVRKAATVFLEGLMNLADVFVETGDVIEESANLFNPELAIVYGPFSFQAEYTHLIMIFE